MHLKSLQNYTFGDNITPPPSGDRSFSYKIFPLFTLSIYYWAVRRDFWEEGEGDFVLEIGFHGYDFPCGGKFPEVKVPGEILHLGDLTEFGILFVSFTLSLSIHFCMWSCSGGIGLGKFSACLDFQEVNFHGRGDYRSD